MKHGKASTFGGFTLTKAREIAKNLANKERKDQVIYPSRFLPKAFAVVDSETFSKTGWTDQIEIIQPDKRSKTK